MQRIPKEGKALSDVRNSHSSVLPSPQVYLDASHSCGTKQNFVVLPGISDELLCVCFWNTFGDDSYHSDGGLLQSFKGRLKGAAPP